MALTLASCGDTGLPEAAFENAVDTVTIYALRGTAIALPSAYDLVFARPARTDLGEGFDFAFDVDAGGNPVLLPLQVLGFDDETAGAQFFDGGFADVIQAPFDGYVTDGPLVIGTGDVFVARSRLSASGCDASLGELPRYGKFHVVAVDLEQRLAVLEALVNVNCGYRGLEPGLPVR